jgi:TRAP-type uncharacterized transport system substrate-binding protein
MVARNGYNWPEYFNVGALIAPGLNTPEVDRNWTPVLAEDTGMKVHVTYVSANNKATKFKWMRYGIVDICDGGAYEFSQMLRGERYFADRDTGAFPVRVVWVFSKYDSGFIVRGDSHIKDIYDIKPGVRVVDMRSYLDSQTNVEGLLRWAGIQDLEKDVTWVPAHSTEEKAQLVVDGKADIAFAVPTSPSIYEAEKNPHGIRWIDLNGQKDPEGAERFHEKCVLMDFDLMFRGVQSCRTHWGMVGTDQFCCRAEADTELIYNLVKWFDENWARYKDSHFWLEQTTLKNLMKKLDTTFIPCHDGLVKYLKELGLWTDAHEERQKGNLDLISRYCVATQEAHRLADEKRIAVFADNPAWVDLWENYRDKQDLPAIKFLPSLGKGEYHS